MKGEEREKIQEKFEKETGGDHKKIKWEIICIETKDQPHMPKSMITGEVSLIYPTGDIVFKKILKMELWVELQFLQEHLQVFMKQLN